jgi:hypothetical protein
MTPSEKERERLGEWRIVLERKLKEASKGEPETWGFVSMFLDMIEKTAEECASLRQADAPVGWVSVDERLPEGGDAVRCDAWCTGEEGGFAGPCVMSFDDSEEGDDRWSPCEDLGCWEPGTVTHWRPRPTATPRPAGSEG